MDESPLLGTVRPLGAQAPRWARRTSCRRRSFQGRLSTRRSTEPALRGPGWAEAASGRRERRRAGQRSGHHRCDPHVKSERVDDYEDWVHRLINAAGELPGFLGADLHPPPADANGRGDHGVAAVGAAGVALARGGLRGPAHTRAQRRGPGEDPMRALDPAGAQHGFDRGAGHCRRTAGQLAARARSRRPRRLG